MSRWKSDYRKKNRWPCNASNAKYRANLKRSTPNWSDLDKIKLIYKNCPEGFEVDHVIPLCGKIVSDLHVSWNLQYLTKTNNKKKHNHFYTERKFNV